jgi:polysaccharide export outer membrane protein
VFTDTLEVQQATVRNLELVAVNSEAPTGTVPAIAQLPGIGTVAPSPAAEPAQQKEAYILGPGDIIEIDIFNVPEYSGQNGHRQQ